VCFNKCTAFYINVKKRHIQDFSHFFSNCISDYRQIIYYGQGALQSLTNVSGKRALIVTDPVIRSLGLVEKVDIPLAIKDSEMEPLVAGFMNWIARVPVEARRSAGMPVESEEVKELYRHAWNGTRADLGGG